MFYSHQLLCKKGPLGQIWIAATMYAKINRKKTEQIDIEEICMQILQPQVPLALRLSGILMANNPWRLRCQSAGGVVLVFHRKVKFLHDDVTEFLVKIKTAMSTKSNDHVISLPKGKSHARYENVTINYDFDAFDDIERPMMRPRTPEQRSSDREIDMFGRKEYIIVTKPRSSSRQPIDTDVDLDKYIYHGPDHLQVDSADITLEDNNRSSTEQFGDFGMDILEERFPASDHDIMDIDTFFPEIRLSDEIKPPLSTAIDTTIDSNTEKSQEQQLEQDPIRDLQKSPSQREEPVGPESPEHREATAAAAPAPARKKRKRQVRFNRTVFDDIREIPSPVFESWLRKPEDITGREIKQENDSGALRIEMLFRLPSASLSHRSCIPELVPDWTDQLTNLWNRDFGKRSEAGDRDYGIRRSPTAPILAPDTSVQGNRADSKSGSDPSGGQSGGEFYLSSQSDTRANVEPAAEELQEVEPTNDNDKSGMRYDNLDSAERCRSFQTDLKDYGSVEKLRAALRSPSTGSDHLGGSQLNLTPSLSGQFGVTASGRPSRPLSTPGSAKLPFDVEIEPFTTGSGRFRKPRLSSPGIGPAEKFFADNDIPPLDGFGDSDYFAGLRGTLQGSLTQFDLLEETGASAHGSGSKQEALNNVSVTVLQCLRQHFNDLGAQCKEHQSLYGLAQGMDRSQAAKLFYQILVLSSNNYLAVSQDVPFGDILVSRGGL